MPDFYSVGNHSFGHRPDYPWEIKFEGFIEDDEVEEFSAVVPFDEFLKVEPCKRIDFYESVIATETWYGRCYDADTADWFDQMRDDFEEGYMKGRTRLELKDVTADTPEGLYWF